MASSSKIKHEDRSDPDTRISTGLAAAAVVSGGLSLCSSRAASREVRELREAYRSCKTAALEADPSRGVFVVQQMLQAAPRAVPRYPTAIAAAVAAGGSVWLLNKSMETLSDTVSASAGDICAALSKAPPTTTTTPPIARNRYFAAFEALYDGACQVYYCFYPRSEPPAA